MTVGYLAHSFDLLHVRHLDLISQAAKVCSHLVVGVFSDEFAQMVNGRRPVVPFMERMSLVQHVRGVDEVVVHDGHPGDSARLGLPDLIFEVAGEPAYGRSTPTYLLTPRRESASLVLRQALEPRRRGEVA